MKFIDPLASLQYMGGALPLHVAMAVYCFDQYYSNLEFVQYECLDKLSDPAKIKLNDVFVMLFSHIVYIICIGINFLIENNDMYNPRYFRQSMKHYNIIFYILSIISIQDKIYRV